jgi:hypothetical protein
VRDSIRDTEILSLNRLGRLVEGTALPEAAPCQTSGHLTKLLENGFAVKRTLYDPFFKSIEEEDRKEGRKRLKFFDSKLKGIWRCIEKMELRRVPVESCESICDVVRGAISSATVAALADVYQRLLDAQAHDILRILRVKNRLKHANDSGWADCLANFVFLSDPTGHVCEVQLVHEKLMLVRKNMGAHESYSFFRSALELLEATDTTGTWAQ